MSCCCSPLGPSSAPVAAAGAVQEIRFAIGTGAAQNSVTSVPNGAVVLSAELNIVTPYSAAATLQVGRAASLALLMATTDNNPQEAGLYQVAQDTVFPGPATILVSVAGAPAAGAGFCIVRYVQTPQP